MAETDKKLVKPLGIDLLATTTQILDPQSRFQFDTHVIVCLPKGHFARIAPRCNLKTRGLDLQREQVTYNSGSTIKLMVQNVSEEPILVEEGEPLAELIFEACHCPPSTKVNWKSNCFGTQPEPKKVTISSCLREGDCWTQN